MSKRATPDASDESEHDPIFVEAAVWVARLSSPDATAEDHAAFEVWRSTDPAHAEAHAELDAWRRMMGGSPDPRRRNWPTGPIAVMLAMGAFGLAADETGWIDRLRADAWTGVGGIATTILPDGSRIDLDTDTAVVLHDTPGERRVTVLRGEAVFDVVHDRDRPFIVHSAGLTVRAVGTRFFVRADGTPEPVGVAEGRVDVGTGGRIAMVTANEVAHRSAEGRLTVQPSDVAQAIAWREGKLVASGRPLAAIVASLDRYRRGRIVLLDPSLGARRFTGTLDLSNTDDALAVLAASLRLKITRVPPFLVLIRGAS
ncbi:FecR family protein [Methylobacterium indicum]|uniref:FecR family protein n=1 Tax=Methylobacterium indicum TaxID=1775910 RepID=UPI002435AD88|nr:FecR domain-containing protein [Methylobacterium indicum]